MVSLATNIFPILLEVRYSGTHQRQLVYQSSSRTIIYRQEHQTHAVAEDTAVKTNPHGTLNHTKLLGKGSLVSEAQNIHPNTHVWNRRSSSSMRRFCLSAFMLPAMSWAFTYTGSSPLLCRHVLDKGSTLSANTTAAGSMMAKSS